MPCSAASTAEGPGGQTAGLVPVAGPDVSGKEPAGDHPRPQLTRPGWRDLCGTWDFCFDDQDQGVAGQWFHRADVFDRRILVPFPFESEASGIGDTSHHRVVWYRRSFTATVQGDRRLLLHLGAVDYSAQVWVNGQAVASHQGGHTPFSADITSVLDPSGEQVVVVRAEDDPTDLRQPRGKQDWQQEPHAIWYDPTSGIWQPVWLEEVSPTHIAAVRWTADVDTRSIDLTVRVRGRDTQALALRVVLRRSGQVLADDTYSMEHSEIQRRISLVETDVGLKHSDLLWSPEHPNLIEAHLTLLDRSAEAPGAVVDSVGSYTALRSIGTSGGRMLLNGQPYYLRLVLAQNFWPDSHLASPSGDALRQEVELVKGLGFNGIRLHQKVEDPRFLAWCDRLGLLVWAEMPSAYEFSTVTIERLTREWMEVLERDASHPCIIAWVPMNESWGVPALARSRQQQDLVRGLYHLTKALDPTRLVIGNDGWEQPVTDVVTVHDYAAKGSVLRDRYGDWSALDHSLAHTQPHYRSLLLDGVTRDLTPVMITEFGGVTLDVGHGPRWGGYGSVSTAEQLLSCYRDLVGALLDSPAVMGFCWTQLTDTQQERNGLLTAQRNPKVAIDLLHAVTTRASAAVPGDAVTELAYDDWPVTHVVVEGVG